jgi:hypothetical protein
VTATGEVAQKCPEAALNSEFILKRFMPLPRRKEYSVRTKDQSIKYSILENPLDR